jgi:hypothetical protein
MRRLFVAPHESGFGPKADLFRLLVMSAFEAKADVPGIGVGKPRLTEDRRQFAPCRQPDSTVTIPIIKFETTGL